MKKLLVLLGVAAVLAAPVAGGVVFEIETTDHGPSPPRTESIEAAVEGRNLKMGIASRGSGGAGTMIFRGDRREMVVADDDAKTYTVIDTDMIQQLAGQVSGAMAQIEEALKNVPEDQREIVEKMMKQRMPQQVPPQRPATELRKTGERAEKAGYPCVRYDVLRDGKKIRELWVTDWDNVEGGRDVVGTFEDMAAFFKSLMDAIPNFGQGPVGDDSAFVHLKETGGFPVVTRELAEDGSLESESTLRSAKRQTLDPDAFEPPAGYKRQEMFGSR